MSKAGQFRERVTFYTPGTAVSDGAGGLLASAAETSVTAWARVQALTAKEDLVNGKVTYRQPYKITIRHTSGMSNTNRIEWNGKQLSITSVVGDERSTEIYFYGCQLQ